MAQSTIQFGYLPIYLEFETSTLCVSTLSNLNEIKKEIENDKTVSNGWIYSGSQQSRIFSLPKTHQIKTKGNESKAYLEFMVWVFSFMFGMRLTSTEAGFLDATPIRQGKLTDFGGLTYDSRLRFIESADNFLEKKPK